ncbi:MAG: hypothetical protein ABIX37_07170 [Gammaproteobacteria bacterium]
MRPLVPLALLLTLPLTAAADGLTNAYFLCDIFAKTGVSTECLASHGLSTVDVIINTSEAEARNVCSVMAKGMIDRKRSFGGWQLRIFAPEHAEEPLAVCLLK